MTASHRTSASAPSPHVIDVTAAGIRIDDTVLDDVSVSTLTFLFGTPRIEPPDIPGPGRNTLVIWDDVGVRAFTKGDDAVTELTIRLTEDAELLRSMKPGARRLAPTVVFGGTFTLDGQPPLDAVPDANLRKAYRFLEAEVGEWQAILFLNSTELHELHDMEMSERLAKMDSGELADIVRAAADPISEARIGIRAPKPVQRKPSGRWKIPTATEPVLEISSFPLRLAIIQELMYRQDALQPRFNVHDFAQDQGARSFDPNEIGYEIIPAVRSWFRRLPIPARLAERVETLVLDGGNDIYLQLIPQWDGEDDGFNIKTLRPDDLALFTRLRAVDDIGGFLSTRARNVLTARGITVT